MFFWDFKGLDLGLGLTAEGDRQTDMGTQSKGLTYAPHPYARLGKPEQVPTHDVHKFIRS